MRSWLYSNKIKGLAALVAGLFAALGQVPFSIWPLGLAGFAAAIWFVRDASSWKQSALRAWAFGFGHFFLTLHWITQPFQVEAEKDAWMAPFAWVLMALGLGLFWLLAGGLAHLAKPRLRGVAFALLLLASEALRSVIFTGFPWALPGHIWLDHAPAQLASLAGAGGLGLLTLGLALSLQRLKAIPLGVVVLAAVWGWGAWREAQVIAGKDGPIIRLVQPNADQVLKWDPQYAQMFFERHLDLSLTPAAEKPAMILWPETSVPFWLDADGGGLGVMARALGGVPTAFGIQRGDGPRAYNSMAILGEANGQPEILHVYDKHQLVPFGEYIPLGDVAADLLGIFSFSPEHGSGYSAGPGPQVLSLPGLGRFQPLICYEVVFPWFQRQVDRPEWLLQITNDAWFGNWAGPSQHLSLARLRAIENGLPLMRVANTGISAVIDAKGRVLQQLGMGVQGIIDAPLPPVNTATIYSRFGGIVALMIWLIAAFTFSRFNFVKD